MSDEITPERMRQSADGFHRFPDCPITHGCSLETARLLEAGADALERCAELEDTIDALRIGNEVLNRALTSEVELRNKFYVERVQEAEARCAEMERLLAEAAEWIEAAAKGAEEQNCSTALPRGSTPFTKRLKRGRQQPSDAGESKL